MQCDPDKSVHVVFVVLQASMMDLHAPFWDLFSASVARLLYFWNPSPLEHLMMTLSGLLSVVLVVGGGELSVRSISTQRSVNITSTV